MRTSPLGRLLFRALLTASAVLAGVAAPTAQVQSPAADGSFLVDATGGAYTPTIVYSLAIQPNGAVLVAGDFSTLADWWNCWFLGRVGGDGTPDTTYTPGLNGIIYSLAVQADGRVVLGGFFSLIGSQDCFGVARINADGSFDTAFNGGTDDVVSNVVLQADGKILVGGAFLNLSGQARSHIGRLNADGSLDPVFNPGANGAVSALAVQPDGKILVGGNFTLLGGQSRTNLGRLNADGTVDAAFNPGPRGTVNTLAVQPDGKILVGGLLTAFAGQARTNLGRLNTNGTLDPSFSLGANGAVYSFAIQADGRVIVGGAFSTLGTATRRGIGRFYPNGAVDAGFDLQTDGKVYALAMQMDGGILIGGTFDTVGGQPFANLARLCHTDAATNYLSLTGSTATWLRTGTGPEAWRTSFSTTTNGTNWTVVGAGVRLTNGWQLTGVTLPTGTTLHAQAFVNGGYANGTGWFVDAYCGAPLLATEPAGTTNPAGTAASFSVAAIPSDSPCAFRWLKQGVPLVDGGNLSGSGTATLTLSNVLHASAGNYSAVLSNAFGSVTSAVAALTVVDPFLTWQPSSQIGDVGANVTLSAAAAGTGPLAWQWWKGSASMPGRTQASLTLTNLQLSDAGNYFVTVSNQWGILTSVTAQLTVNLAARDTTFSPGVTNPATPNGVYALAVQENGQILLGGDFLAVAGQTRNFLGRLGADGSLDRAFNPGAGGPVYPAVYGFGIRPDDSILVCGSYQTIGGASRTNIALLNADGSLNSGFSTGVIGWLPFIYAMAMQADGRLMLGGYLPQFGSRPCSNVVRVNTDGTFDSSLIVDLDTYSYTLAIQTNGAIVMGGGFTNLWEPGETPSGESHLFLARLAAAGTIDGAFHAGTDGGVYAVAVQADGKTLVGGDFWEMGYFYDPGLWNPTPHRTLGRVYPNGTIDETFAPAVDGAIQTIALQADGKILLGGTLSVQTTNGWLAANLARLNPDGSVDGSFNASTDGEVDAVAIQADGKILLGGQFSSLCGQPCGALGRLNNTEPVTNSLNLSGTAITWVRGGASPEVWRVTFEASTDGTNWVSLGNGTRIVGGWLLGSVSVAPNATVRARGYVVGGYHNASTWFVESRTSASTPLRIGHDAQFGVGPNGFGFNLQGPTGSVVVVECSSNLLNWMPLTTNTLSSSPWHFSDPSSRTKSKQFYRGRLLQ